MSDETPKVVTPKAKRRKENRKPAAVRAPMVRYSKRVVNDLLTYIAQDGMSLWEACTHEGMPVVGTVVIWLNESDLAKEGDEKYGFSKAYERAIEARTHYIEHRVSKEARTPREAEEVKVTYEWVPAPLLNGKTDPRYPNGWMKVETGVEVKKVDAVDRSRLAVDTDKWFLARMKPASTGTRYGYGTQSASVNVNGANPETMSADGRPIFHINIINSPDAD